MNFKERKEKEILEDIKSLSERLSKVNNFSGLVMYQSEIQRFYEDFVFLKKLNNIKDAKDFEPVSEKVEEIKQAENPETVKPESEKPVEATVEFGIQESAENKSPKIPILDDKINYNFSIQTGKKHKPLLIDLNDNIAFLNYLFKGEKEEYETFIENLNERNQITSESFINHYIQLKGWTKKQAEYIERLAELNRQRFE